MFLIQYFEENHKKINRNLKMWTRDILQRRSYATHRQQLPNKVDEHREYIPLIKPPIVKTSYSEPQKKRSITFSLGNRSKSSTSNLRFRGRFTARWRRWRTLRRLGGALRCVYEATRDPSYSKTWNNTKILHSLATTWTCRSDIYKILTNLKGIS